MLRSTTSKKGFTLAEVLVTLVVIGIVAALTIPALLENTNQAELKTAFKKSVATLNQAIVMSVAQDSVDVSNVTSSGDNSAALANFFMNKLNVISSNTTAASPTFFTADGMQYTVTKYTAGGCNASSDTNANSTTANCVVSVDVNGGKSPNTVSTGNSTATYSFKDQYSLIVRKNSVVPAANTTSDVAVAALQQ